MKRSRRDPENWRQQAALLASWTFGLLGLGLILAWWLAGMPTLHPPKEISPAKPVPIERPADAR